MGLYDRDYIRDDEQPGYFLGGQRSMVTTLILLNVGIFLADVLMDGRLSEFLMLKPDLFQKPWNAWQLLTAGFAHDRENILHVGFNMFELWLFGRDVEVVYGKKEFLRVYLSLIVMSSLVWLISVVAAHRQAQTEGLIGASGAVVGIIILFVCHFPRRIFNIWGVVPVPAWLVGSLCILQDFFGGSNPSLRDNVAYVAHLAGAAFAYVYYSTGWNLGRWWPSRLSLSALKPRPKLRVHDPEPEENLSDQVDRILEKISRQGETSLTAQERRTLEDASRRYQKRRQ